MTQRIFQLDADYPDFPNPELASTSPNGLLAVGGDLSPARLVNAYSQGIFPWFNENEPILWWSPDPRGVLELDELIISKSMRKFLNRHNFKITINQAFCEVIENCANTPRPSLNGTDNDTWITLEMLDAYEQLHQLGFAHSVEVWDDDALVGGLYGVSMGKIFCGESMFHHKTNASKVAFIALVNYLKEQQFELIDCQLQNDHLASLGCKEISRAEFLERLNKALKQKPVHHCWYPQELVYGK